MWVTERQRRDAEAKAREDELKVQKQAHTTHQPKPPTTMPAIPLSQIGNASMSTLSSGNYSFEQIPYQSLIIPALELITQPLDSYANKTPAQWAAWSQKNPGAGTPVDAEILYQCLLRAYNLRNDPAHKPMMHELTKLFHGLFDPAKPNLNTLTKIVYQTGLQAQISRLGTFPGGSAPITLDIPEFTKADTNWSYVVLAPEQGEGALGNLLRIGNAGNVLRELLGNGYEQAGAVFQYFSPRKNNNLREARLWTPTTTNRNQERVVSLGVGNYGRFDIIANDYVDGSRPALGVRPVAPKFST